MQIVAAQSGDFARDKGRQVMETLLQAHPEATAVYAHNDEMAMGALAALEAAGRKPGQDITVVSIDGTRDALQAIVDGKIGAVVESNPRFGPNAFETAKRYAAGEDRHLDQGAGQFLRQVQRRPVGVLGLLTGAGRDLGRSRPTLPRPNRQIFRIPRGRPWLTQRPFCRCRASTRASPAYPRSAPPTSPSAAPRFMP